MNAPAHPRPDWDVIDTVLLDLDGTLLDQAYDNHIWRELVPQRFAAGQAGDVQAARAEILRRFAATSGTLAYYDLEHWSRELGIDIGALHREARAQVAWLPGASPANWASASVRPSAIRCASRMSADRARACDS